MYRTVAVKFWADEFIAKLTPEQKYFYLYLLTNELTLQCGIYEITTRRISFDTGYNSDTIEKLLKYFQQQKKIIFDKSTSELAILNWPEYNLTDSPKVVSCIKNQLKNVKSKALIEALYGNGQKSEKVENQAGNRVSIPNPNKHNTNTTETQTQQETVTSIKNSDRPWIRIVSVPPVFITSAHEYFVDKKETIYDILMMNKKHGNYEKLGIDFVMDRMGCDFNGEDHLWNAYKKWLDSKKIASQPLKRNLSPV